MSGSGDTTRYRFSFPYKLLKPDEAKEEEYQFEELRAMHYRSMMQIKAQVAQKYEDEISELKAKLNAAGDEPCGCKAAKKHCETTVWSTRHHIDMTISNENLTNVTTLFGTRKLTPEAGVVLDKTLAKSDPTAGTTMATTFNDTTNLNKVNTTKQIFF
jgi:hypothetical protein